MDPHIDSANEEAKEEAKETTINNEKQDEDPLGIFEKYLSIWILFCIVIGVLIGYYVPQIPEALNKAEVHQVNIPIAVFIWALILPMLLQIDYTSVKNVWKAWRGITLTTGINYLIQPFTMYGLALLFFNHVFANVISPELQTDYIIGAVLLGGSPCTAMVFVWSFLVNGDATYTLAQVIVNDLVLLVAYIPTIQLLVGLSGVTLPWITLILSVVIFVVVPGILGGLLRWYIVSKHGVKYLNKNFLPKVKPFSIIFLLLILVLIFIYQADRVVRDPVHILIIAIPLIIQTFFIWGFTYTAAYVLKLPFKISAPASMIATSNFFELAVAISISVLGPDSGATLVTTVGVLTEVPVMLLLVWLCNKTKNIFDKFDTEKVDPVDEVALE